MNEVLYARARDINFKSAKKLKAELDLKIDDFVGEKQSRTSAQARHSKTSNVLRSPNEDEIEAQLKKLNPLDIKSRSQHVVTISDLYDPSYLNLNYPELLKKCLEVNLNLNDSELDAIEADTRKQSKGNLFYRHRAGRIGASVSWSVTHSNPTQPLQSLIKSLCYPRLFKVTSKAVTHGEKHEASAVEAYVS